MNIIICAMNIVTRSKLACLDKQGWTVPNYYSDGVIKLGLT